jgi:hypothetical protein
LIVEHTVLHTMYNCSNGGDTDSLILPLLWFVRALPLRWHCHCSPRETPNIRQSPPTHGITASTEAKDHQSMRETAVTADGQVCSLSRLHALAELGISLHRLCSVAELEAPKNVPCQ